MYESLLWLTSSINITKCYDCSKLNFNSSNEYHSQELVDFGLILPEVVTDPTTVRTSVPSEQGLTWFDYFLIVLGAAVTVFAAVSIIMAVSLKIVFNPGLWQNNYG